MPISYVSSAKDSYTRGELEALNPLDEYGVNVQLNSSSGRTKYLKLTVELAEELLKLAYEAEKGGNER